MSLRVYSKAPGNVLHNAPDEALVMNVKSEEIEPSIDLLEMRLFNSITLPILTHLDFDYFPVLYNTNFEC